MIVTTGSGHRLKDEIFEYLKSSNPLKIDSKKTRNVDYVLGMYGEKLTKNFKGYNLLFSNDFL